MDERIKYTIKNSQHFCFAAAYKKSRSHLVVFDISFELPVKSKKKKVLQHC